MGGMISATMPPLIAVDDSPAGYSLAGWSPPEPASASPAALRMRYSDTAGRNITSSLAIANRHPAEDSTVVYRNEELDEQNWSDDVSRSR